MSPLRALNDWADPVVAQKASASMQEPTARNRIIGVASSCLAAERKLCSGVTWTRDTDGQGCSVSSAFVFARLL
jgi:hypothetical protein